MVELQQRVEAIEKKLQLRLPGSSFGRQLAEKLGDPLNWVLGIGEMHMPKVFFVGPTMASHCASHEYPPVTWNCAT